MLGFRIIRASRTFAGLRTSVKYDENRKWFLRSTLKIERELDKEGELCMPDPIINPIVIPRRFYCLPVGENAPAPNLSSGRRNHIEFKEIHKQTRYLRPTYEELLNKLITSEKKKQKLQDQVDVLQGMVGAVGGRGIMDKFFSNFIKRYLPTKVPGKPYTSSQIKQAYIEFFKDKKNDVAVDLMSNFSRETTEEVAEIYMQLFGKLSWYDHTMYEALLKTRKFDGFVKLLQSIPAVLEDSEIKRLEQILAVFIKHNKDWKEYVHEM